MEAVLHDFFNRLKLLHVTDLLLRGNRISNTVLEDTHVYCPEAFLIKINELTTVIQLLLDRDINARIISLQTHWWQEFLGGTG